MNHVTEKNVQLCKSPSYQKERHYTPRKAREIPGLRLRLSCTGSLRNASALPSASLDPARKRVGEQEKLQVSLGDPVAERTAETKQMQVTWPQGQ